MKVAILLLASCGSVRLCCLLGASSLSVLAAVRSVSARGMEWDVVWDWVLKELGSWRVEEEWMVEPDVASDGVLSVVTPVKGKKYT